MKKNYLKLFSFLSLFLFIAPSVSSCASSDHYDDILRIYNWEDYIYLNDPDEGYTEKDLVEQFEDYIYETEGRKINVIYDTFDTNESMLSQIKTGKVSYDLICPSDYTIQRMIQDDLLEPFDEGSTPNYDKNVSDFLLNKLDAITITKYDENNNVIKEQGLVNKYARGYFWGTLGLIYNPNNGEIDPDEMRADLQNWSCLWDEKYHNKVSIKDSMRDTYAAGIMEAFKSEFTSLRNDYLANKLSEEEYNKEVTKLFNRSDDEAISKVLDALLRLKENIFGFEVDSGKEDIQTGKIWINLAWSGDATYAMDQAESNENPVYLEYSIPNLGANIWFDGWVMPKGANKDLAQKFVDFISMSDIAVENVDYTGYTSFITSYEVFDLISSWYDPRYFENEELDPNYDISGGRLKDVSYVFGTDLTSYGYPGKYGFIDENGEVITDSNGNPIEPKFFVPEEETYRQIDTLFPDKEQLSYLAVMDDFPIDTRGKILNMWEELKGTPMPLYAYILIGVGLLLVIGFILFTYLKKRYDRKQRKLRREELRIIKNKNVL